MKDRTMTASVAVSLVLPSLPNFIRVAGKMDRSVDVADMDDKTLTDIGREWTDALIQHAKKRRSQRKVQP